MDEKGLVVSLELRRVKVEVAVFKNPPGLCGRKATLSLNSN